MKNLITLMIAMTVMASCSKAQHPEPDQWVTITASCESCSIEINGKTTHFGGWISYTYQNTTGQDTAMAILSVPVKYTKSQELYLEIKENIHGNVATKRRVIRSYIEDGTREEPFTVEVELNLKSKIWK